MSDPKLFVMQKKFAKFIKTTLLKTTKEKLSADVINKDGSGFRSRILFFKQQCLKKGHRPFFRNPNGRKVKPFGRVLVTLFRSLDNSAGSRFGQLPIVTTFYRAFLPYMLRDQRGLRALWIRSGNELRVPNLSRRFRGNSKEPLVSGQSAECRARPDGSLLEKENHSDRMFESLVEQCNGTAEQRFYTEGVAAKKDTSAAKRKLEQIEDWERQLPPRQRCRLSCPLPPIELIAPEENEFLLRQSAAVRSSSLPAEFFPTQENAAERKAELVSPKGKEHTSSKKRNPYVSIAEPALANLPGSLPKTIKNKKTYFDLQQLKSRLYQPQPEAVPKMKALLFEPDSLALNYDAVNAPTMILKDEVLVQVSYSGVCGSDLFITEGKVSCGANPVILGHEISGKVYAAGSSVQHVRLGDKIAVNAYTACRVCRYCSLGFYSACTNEGLNNSIGTSKNGGWAEFVVVKKCQVHKIPAELGLDQAALIQPLSCVLSALSKLNISHGMDILILGLGLSGSLWASILHSRGIKSVFVSDRSPGKRVQFESLGLGYMFIPPEDVRKYTVDVIIECTGAPTSIEKAFNILNPNGQMCFFGKPNPTTEVRCIPYEIINKEITIVGNAGNAFCFSEAIDLATSMGHRYLDFDKLGVRVFDLEDYKEAFQLKKLGEVGKIMFKFDR